MYSNCAETLFVYSKQNVIDAEIKSFRSQRIHFFKNTFIINCRWILATKYWLTIQSFYTSMQPWVTSIKINWNCGIGNGIVSTKALLYSNHGWCQLLPHVELSDTLYIITSFALQSVFSRNRHLKQWTGIYIFVSLGEISETFVLSQEKYKRLTDHLY